VKASGEAAWPIRAAVKPISSFDLGVAILERRTTIYKISSLGSFDLFATVT
jgi:hypothetical protein